MKQSLYNNFIPLKTGGVLGYNSLKRRFAVFTNDPKTLLKESEASNNSSSQEYIRLKRGASLSMTHSMNINNFLSKSMRPILTLKLLNFISIPLLIVISGAGIAMKNIWPAQK